MSGFYWGPDGSSSTESSEKAVGTARVLGEKPVATQWCERLTMQHVYDLLATCQRRGMQWRDASVLQEQRQENGRIWVRLLVVDDPGSVYD